LEVRLPMAIYSDDPEIANVLIRYHTAMGEAVEDAYLALHNDLGIVDPRALLLGPSRFVERDWGLGSAKPLAAELAELNELAREELSADDVWRVVNGDTRQD
jgi:hypothetical protein